MARKDIITTDDTLPTFLVDHVDGPVQQVPSRLSKAAMSIIVAIGVGVAIALRLVGPEKIFAEVNASLIDVPFLKRDADQAAPTPQTAASEPQVSQSTASETPTRDEIPAAVNVVDRSQTEISDAQSGALLKQFQTWAVEKDAQAAPAQAVQPMLDSSLRDVKQDESNNEVAPSRGDEQIDDVLDGLVGAVVGGFKSAVWAILRVRTAVEAAVGKWSAQPFVEEQK